MKNLKIKELFIELRAQGISYAKIAEQLSVSKPTLIEWSREFEAQIHNMKQMNTEAVCEKYRIGKEARLEQFGIFLGKIRDEIEKRDFSEVPVEKLIDLACKVGGIIKEETSDLSFIETDQFSNLHWENRVGNWKG